MSEEVEDRSFPESETSGIEAEFKKSNNKYTRAFLLEFCDATVCGKLPPDFDLSTLVGELDDTSEDKIEGKRTSSNPSLSGSLLSNRWNFGVHGERWGRQSFILSKGSQPQVACHSDKRGTGFQPLLGQSGYKAGILVPEGQKSDLFQLRKSGNPYRSPHCLKIVDNAKLDSNASLEETDLAKKKGPFLEISKSVTIEQCETETVDVSVLDETEYCVAQEINIGVSDADQSMVSFTVMDSSNKCSTTPNKPPLSHLQINSGGSNNLIEKTPLLDSCSEHGMEMFMKPCLSTVENDQGDSVYCTTEDDNFECEFPFSDEEIYINSIFGECGGREYVELGKIKDNKCTSDDQRAEISQILQLERVYDHIPNSKIESQLPENLDFNILDNSDDVANSDAEINLPHQDTLITIDDFIFPPLSTSSISRFKVQPFLDVSGPVTHGKLHSLHSQSHDILHSKIPHFHPGIDHVKFFNPFTTPTITQYLPPSLYCHTCSNTYPTSFNEIPFTKLKANDSLVQYSLSQQPYISPQQQNQTLVHPTCTEPIQKAAALDLNTMHLIPRTSSDKALFQGFGKSHSGRFGDQRASSMLNADKFYRGIPYSRTQAGNGT